jgi:hypothetical protein
MGIGPSPPSPSGHRLTLMTIIPATLGAAKEQPPWRPGSSFRGRARVSLCATSRPVLVACQLSILLQTLPVTADRTLTDAHHFCDDLLEAVLVVG